MRATRRADIRRILLASPILATVSSAGLAQADIPRMPDGKPDLSGTYDIATLTPIERSRSFGDRLLLDQLRVTERFSRIDGRTLRYEFTVDDPEIWTASWSGEYPWPATTSRLYEFACHEGNYTMQSILQAARLAESEAQ